MPVRWKPVSSTVPSGDQSLWPAGLQFLPDHVHSASAHLGVAAHDRDTGCEGAIDAEDYSLSASGNHSQAALGVGVVAPAGQGGMSEAGRGCRAQPHPQEPTTCRLPDHHAHRVDADAQRSF